MKTIKLEIFEADLLKVGLSESDFFNGSTLTQEQLTKLRNLLSGSSLDVSKPIMVEKVIQKHGITFVQVRDEGT